MTGDAAGPVVIQPATAAAAIRLDRVSHLTISGITFRPTTDTSVAGQGIQIERSRDVVIERCTFDRLSRGLGITTTDGVRIDSCVATRCTIGFFLQQAARARLAHLSVAGCTSQAVMLLNCGKGQIVDSLFVSNNISVSADPVSAAVWDCDHNVTRGPAGPWGGIVATQNIYEWNAASEQDRHSVYVVPAFVDPEHYDLHIDPHITWAGGLPGNSVGIELDPKVDLDRDGMPFSARDGAVCAGAYNYPEPVLSDGWKKLPAKIPATGKTVRQSAAVYSSDGTLVRTLLADAAGVHDLYWDGLDDLGKAAPAGSYEVRAVGHDVRVRDDGYFGNSGAAIGGFDPPDASRVVTFGDGQFAVTSSYDESGVILRTFAATGKPVFGDNLVDRNFAGLAMWDNDILAVAGENEKTHLIRLSLPGNLTAMPDGRAGISYLRRRRKTLADRGSRGCRR